LVGSEIYNEIKRRAEKRAFMGYEPDKDDGRLLSLLEVLKTIESENIRELKKMLEEKKALKICSYCGHIHENLVDICEECGTELK